MQHWRVLFAGLLVPSLSLAQSVISTNGALAATPKPQVSVPAHWRPCGNANESYAMRSDYEVVYNGVASASLASRGSDAPPDRFGAFCQATLGDPFRGRRVSFSAYIRTDGVSGGARLWVRADARGTPVAFDNMGVTPIRGTRGWARYTVVVDVPSDADRLVYGVALHGAGKLWIDEAAFAIDGRTLEPGNNTSAVYQSEPWLVPVPTNLDFEDTVDIGE